MNNRIGRFATVGFFSVFLIGALFAAPAQASVGDFFQTLLKPFRQHSTVSTTTPQATSTPQPKSFFGSLFRSSAPVPPEQPPVPLYKPVIDYEKAVIEAVKRASPAVVSVTVSKNVPVIEQCPTPLGGLPPEFQQFFGDTQFFTPCEKGVKFQEVGGGSGFIISSDGLILTNKHVASDPKASYTVFTNDGKKHAAKVLARDPSQDLAVLKIEATGLPVVELGDSENIELGQTAIAIGNALAEYRNTVSLGVISGLSRTITAGGGGTVETLAGVIQTDAAINQGNSGGPLLNLRGEVVGINTAVVSGAQNIGFAIPINQAKRDILSVKKNGNIEVPFLGVRYQLVNEEVVKTWTLSVDHGALVHAQKGPAVEPGSPAAAAGVKEGDVIVEVNGKTINEDNPLGPLVAQYSVGQTITITLIREGKQVSLEVTLSKRPDSL